MHPRIGRDFSTDCFNQMVETFTVICVISGIVIHVIAVIGVAGVAGCRSLYEVCVDGTLSRAWDGLGKVEQASARKAIEVIVYL
jgi:hypothetical protein